MDMLGSHSNPVQFSLSSWVAQNQTDHNAHRGSNLPHSRYKLPHGWIVTLRMDSDDTNAAIFVPFAEHGSGWGKDDPVKLWTPRDSKDPYLKQS